MGGRMASQYAAGGEPGRHAALAGLVFLGYPLHPPGRPDQLRSAHLPSVRAPMLFVQGERDTFGTTAELAPILRGLPLATLHVVERGDHSLTVSRNADKQRAADAAWRQALLDWMAKITPEPAGRS
jgi:predicted alpha/beta-hydrolase family hydrolase